MLKMKHTSDGKWLVYNTDNFFYHTHTPHKRIALRLKYMAEHHITPHSRNLKFVDSLLRLTSNKRYKRELLQYRQLLLKEQEGKHMEKDKKIICDCTECEYNKHCTCTSDNLMISDGYCMSSSGDQEETGEEEDRKLYYPKEQQE